LGIEDEIHISGDLAGRLRGAAERYGFDPEGLIDYLLNVLQGSEPIVPKKEQNQEEFVEVLERLKNLGYT
jgi:hypothetical protein